jgi:hypothetical protein
MGMLIAESRASQTDFVHTVSSIEDFQVHAFFNKLLVDAASTAVLWDATVTILPQDCRLTPVSGYRTSLTMSALSNPF